VAHPLFAKDYCTYGNSIAVYNGTMQATLVQHRLHVKCTARTKTHLETDVSDLIVT